MEHRGAYTCVSCKARVKRAAHAYRSASSKSIHDLKVSQSGTPREALDQRSWPSKGRDQRVFKIDQLQEAWCCWPYLAQKGFQGRHFLWPFYFTACHESLILFGLDPGWTLKGCGHCWRAMHNCHFLYSPLYIFKRITWPLPPSLIVYRSWETNKYVTSRYLDLHKRKRERRI